MLFNSFEFIFVFLPVTLFSFYWLNSHNHHRIAMAFLVFCSLFFYGWWKPVYLPLLLFSLFFNYLFGLILIDNQRDAYRKAILFVGVTVNLCLLCYFKYFNFFIDQFNLFFGKEVYVNRIFLPLAISFFTFQQIAYLVDTYRYKGNESNFLHYSLFVTFFPQLIAGPIVHHSEMLPQFLKLGSQRYDYRHLGIGLTIFVLGLFKKVILADGIAIYATPVFSAVKNQANLTFFEAWGGALAYTLQIYFDFSGYSDMAIGIGKMFGIKLPINFNSPYKAKSIIDFWHRWHITLSRFLRDQCR